MENQNNQPGLYSPQFEHDNCGIGAVVSIKGVKTHQTVSDALSIVENLEHRAGKDAEGKTGDGVGILLQISHKFFKKAVKPLGIKIGEEREYGVGMFFFPQDELARNRAKKMFEIIVEKEGLEFLGWREVPTFPNVLGKKAVDCISHTNTITVMGITSACKCYPAPLGELSCILIAFITLAGIITFYEIKMNHMCNLL